MGAADRTPSHRRRRRAGALAAAGLGLLSMGAATSAAALPPTGPVVTGTLSVDRPCYVFTRSDPHPTMTVTGSGFAPGLVPIDDDQDLLVSGQDPTADATGAFQTTIALKHPFVATAVTLHDTLSADEHTFSAGTYQASVAFTATTQGGGYRIEHPRRGRAVFAQRASWRFTGFPVGRTIYGHYLTGHRQVARQAFGRAGAPCGGLSVRRPLFPAGATARRGSYRLQLDTSRRFSARTADRVELVAR